jgi:hypothetical protein
MVALLVTLGIRLGVFWGFLIPIGLLMVWAFYYDYSHKPRGGWRQAPMGSFAVDANPTFFVNERGDSGVDPTGRTYGGPSHVPTPEEQAAMGGGSWEGLLWVVAELVVLAGLILLVVQVGH